jgi:hypothetical protein
MFKGCLWLTVVVFALAVISETLKYIQKFLTKKFELNLVNTCEKSNEINLNNNKHEKTPLLVRSLKIPNSVDEINRKR